jgi:site-specific DNA recombinase
MKRSRDCDNCVRADAVEREVISNYGDFLINLNDTKKRESNADEIEKAIKKANAKIKKFYNLYAENDSQNLLSLIQEEELRLKSLEGELEKEKSRDMKCDKKSIDEIKRISDAFDILSIQERNKILKECIEKIVINGDEIEIRFVTF